MTTLRIEAPVSDFEAWKAAFDRDPIDRSALGVRAHRIARPVDDAGVVLVDLDFAGRAEADACLAVLERLWAGAEAGPVLSGTPRARIVETVEELAHA